MRPTCRCKGERDSGSVGRGVQCSIPVWRVKMTYLLYSSLLRAVAPKTAETLSAWWSCILWAMASVQCTGGWSTGGRVCDAHGHAKLPPVDIKIGNQSAEQGKSHLKTVLGRGKGFNTPAHVCCAKQAHRPGLHHRTQSSHAAVVDDAAPPRPRLCRSPGLTKRRRHGHARRE